jgi:hypothetical protein
MGLVSDCISAAGVIVLDALAWARLVWVFVYNA